MTNPPEQWRHVYGEEDGTGTRCSFVINFVCGTGSVAGPNSRTGASRIARDRGWIQGHGLGWNVRMKQLVGGSESSGGHGGEDQTPKPTYDMISGLN